MKRTNNTRKCNCEWIWFAMDCVGVMFMAAGWMSAAETEPFSFTWFLWAAFAGIGIIVHDRGVIGGLENAK